MAVAVFPAPADAGPQPELTITRGDELRTGERVIDTRRPDWFDAWRDAHGALDAPDMIASGGHFSRPKRRGNWDCIAAGVFR